MSAGVARCEPTPTANSSAQHAMPYMTQQHALPIHRPTNRYSTDATLSTIDQTSRVENTLRRKTPNGTLTAGYQSDEGPNPHKHQLVPRNAPSGHHASQSLSSGTKRTFLQHEQQRQYGAQSPWYPGDGSGWVSTQHQQPPSSFPVMDSVLNQMPQQQYNTPQQYYAPSQPTFLQPPFNYPGPTASGGQGTGPYGPYWPDGAFVPYRPAPVRDPRFYQHPHGGWHGSLPGSQYGGHASVYPPAPMPHSYGAQTLDATNFSGIPNMSTPMPSNPAQQYYGQLVDPSLQGRQSFPGDPMQFPPQTTGYAHLVQAYPQQAGLQDIQAEFG